MTQDRLDKWTTWAEIAAQPAIWRNWGGTFDPGAIADWIAAQDVDEIWLSGAGTSAYVGDIVAAALEGRAGVPIRSVPSTDIVSRPQSYLRGRRPLVISFGRSGDSTETIGVLDALDALAPQAPRLNITCNPDGALARRAASGAHKVITLPVETHDTGFAMTSSFSTMLLTALGVLERAKNFSDRLTGLAEAFDHLRQGFAPRPRPGRAVFLGTGPLAFAAREAALKVLELTAGQTPALWDSTLGFRHGPKSFVTGDTALFLFASSDPHARRYEYDLAAELVSQFPKATLTVIGPGAEVEVAAPWGDAWAAPLMVGYAQMLAVCWSDALGLNVDAPFEGRGTLTRVVSGVALYRVAP